jgi:hypothetical protein
VTNHLNFCMAATAITWIYGAHLEHAPPRRYSTTKPPNTPSPTCGAGSHRTSAGRVLVAIAGGGQQTDAKPPDRGGDAARGVIENRKLQFVRASSFSVNARRAKVGVSESEPQRFP